MNLRTWTKDFFAGQPSQTIIAAWDMQTGWRFGPRSCFQKRAEAVTSLVRAARPPRREVMFLINAGDVPLRRLVRPWKVSVFGPAQAPGYLDVAAPDFVFGGWHEAGIEDYDAVSDDIAAAGSAPPETDLLGWVGNASVHPSRSRLVDLAGSHPDVMEIIDVGNWFQRGEASSQSLDRPDSGTFRSMAGQVMRYRYLIDVEGGGYSGRLKLLLHSGRAVFIQDRLWKEYFFPDLVPWVHYVPVSRDMSDLAANLKQVSENAALEEAIGSAGKAYARTNLTRSAAIDRWSHLLNVASAP